MMHVVCSIFDKKMVIKLCNNFRYVHCAHDHLQTSCLIHQTYVAGFEKTHLLHTFINGKKIYLNYLEYCISGRNRTAYFR